MTWRNRLIDLTLRASRLLRPRFAWWLGGVLGHCYGLVPGRDVGRALDHLARAYPERDATWVRATQLRCFRHFGRMTLWTLAAWGRDTDYWVKRIPVEGVANCRETIHELAQGKGVVVVSAHLGNWEILARCTGTVLPCTMLGKRLRNPDVDRLVTTTRSDGGRARILYQDDGIAACLRELRNGRLLSTLPDQDVGRLAGGFVPFFGRLAYTPIGPAIMAVMTRRPMQPVYCYAQGSRFVFHWGPLFWPQGSGDRQADALDLTARITAYQEAFMRRRPEQWVWWHKRWRNQPADKPEAPVFGQE